MHIAILASKTGWHTDQLTRAVSARGLEPVLYPWEANVSRIGSESGVTNGQASLAEARGVLVRIIPNGSLEQLIYRVDTLHRLEAQGIRVMNSARAIERTVDKSWTSALLESAGLPTPATVITERVEEAMAAYRAMGDVVVKPLFGSMGLGMARVSDDDMAFRVFRTIELVRGVFYVQQFIPHGGRDIRAFVVGDRVIGAIERTSPGWRTNISRGGSPRALDLSPNLTDLTLRAARAVSAEYAGVDLLLGDDGTPYVLEVNGIPGWQGFQEATGMDVAGEIVNRLLTAGQPGTPD